MSGVGAAESRGFGSNSRHLLLVKARWEATHEVIGVQFAYSDAVLGGFAVGGDEVDDRAGEVGVVV